MDDAGELVLREFGKLILLRAGDNGRSIWEKKLDVPTTQDIELAAAKLSDPAVRSKSRSYADVLERYPQQGHSVERLVYVNVANALLANNISFADSQGVSIKTWGPTAEYCARKKYHSLIPLVSAYSPPDIYADFGAALAALVVDNLKDVRDHSVAFALRGIIQRIVKMACKD